MNHTESFVYVAYSNTNILIPRENVYTVYSISDLNALGPINWENPYKIEFDGEMIPTINIDYYSSLFGEENKSSKVNTVLIIKNKEKHIISKGETLLKRAENLRNIWAMDFLFTSPYVALITSNDCFVKSVDAEKLSFFSKIYSSFFKNLGFLSCFFEEEKLSLSLDVPTFFREAKQRGFL